MHLQGERPVLEYVMGDFYLICNDNAAKHSLVGFPE